MDVERARSFLLALPHATETMQWGDNLVFWVGDKAIGGKMFALITLDGQTPVISFAAGPEHAAELCETEGFRPAPYFARAHWVAAERWNVLVAREWERELAAAHAIVSAKLTARTRETLALPASKRNTLIAKQRRLAASEAAKKGASPDVRDSVSQSVSQSASDRRPSSIREMLSSTFTDCPRSRLRARYPSSTAAPRATQGKRVCASGLMANSGVKLRK